ncbi:hypothetical protein T08_13902 [Trichinella sp. T8]|nr:hypothetical protein T08_13902 [Trichinella sp. T8]
MQRNSEDEEARSNDRRRGFEKEQKLTPNTNSRTRRSTCAQRITPVFAYPYNVLLIAWQPSVREIVPENHLLSAKLEGPNPFWGYHVGHCYLYDKEYARRPGYRSVEKLEQWFSTLDLASNYWQEEVDEVDHEKMASSTPLSNQFQFKAMPFGLCNAPLHSSTEEENPRAGRGPGVPGHSVVIGQRHWIQNQRPKDKTKGFLHRQFKYGRIAFLVYEKIHCVTTANVANLQKEKTNRKTTPNIIRTMRLYTQDVGWISHRRAKCLSMTTASYVTAPTSSVSLSRNLTTGVGFTPVLKVLSKGHEYENGQRYGEKETTVKNNGEKETMVKNTMKEDYKEDYQDRTTCDITEWATMRMKEYYEEDYEDREVEQEEKRGYAINEHCAQFVLYVW